MTRRGKLSAVVVALALGIGVGVAVDLGLRTAAGKTAPANACAGDHDRDCPSGERPSESEERAR